MGWKHRMRAAGFKVMIGLRGRQQKTTLHAPCAMRLALHNRPKWKSTFGFFFRKPVPKIKKASLYAVARNMLVKQVSWSYKQLVQQKAN